MDLSGEEARVDFVIVGSGIAGLYTAIRLAGHGRVLVLSKQELIAGNTWFAQGGIAAAFSAEDSPELHLEDTWKAGSRFGDREAISILVQEAPLRIRDLQEMGVQFDCRNGSLDLGQEGAHSRKRILHIGGDATGRELVEALLRKARSLGVQFIENAFVTRLVTRDGCCCGGCFQKGRRCVLLTSRVVILATGGCGQLFKYTTNSPAVTGDGLALAFRAGAVLRDLEFFQFHPTVFFPPQGRPFLISEAVRGEGARLVNCRGEAFMKDYHPRGELGPRDVVSRAIVSEQRRTGGPVFLDLRHLGADFIQGRFPTIYRRCREWGVDITRELIPVSPAAHYLIGGIQVDLEGRTAVPNLFAVGETASTGVHGANRLASNSLLEGLVFGHRVAAAAAQAEPQAAGGADRDSGGEGLPATTEAERECARLREPLQALMWEKVGLVRREEGLAEALRRLEGWRPLLEYEFLVPELQENRNMLLIALLMTRAALWRRQSKGCHYREDSVPGEDLSRGHISFAKEDLQGIFKEYF